MNYLDARLGFVIRFLPVFFIPFLVLSFLTWSPLTDFIAGAETVSLNYAGVQATASGSLISTPSINFLIIFECSGLVMLILLFALLFAHPPKKTNWVTVAGYGLFLLFFNLVRLFFTLLAGIYFGDAVLGAVHVSLWFVDAGVVFWVWLRLTGIKI
ncbi:MAG: archaeosortase/exosortase family protein [Candidatus Micrarchaeota archaeon]